MSNSGKLKNLMQHMDSLRKDKNSKEKTGVFYEKLPESIVNHQRNRVGGSSASPSKNSKVGQDAFKSQRSGG